VDVDVADPEKIQKLMPAPANQSVQSLQLLQSGRDGASVSSLPISESEDDTQGVSVCLSVCRVTASMICQQELQRLISYRHMFLKISDYAQYML